MANPALRQEIDNGGFIVAPGVYDLIFALIAERMSFKALYVTGYGTVASQRLVTLLRNFLSISARVIG